MLKRVAALIMVLLFAGQAMAGGIVCGVEAISDGLKQSSLDESGEAVCPMEKSGACDDMACCAQGKSPTGSIVAMICCHPEQIRRIQFHLQHGNAAGGKIVVEEK